MENAGLKQEIVEKILDDSELSGKVAKELGVGPLAMYRILKSEEMRQRKRLTQFSVLAILRECLNITQDSDLLETLQTV